MPAILVALACGLVFGAGLTVSQMVDPLRVLGFLDIAGTWDPTLLIVMTAALAVSLPGYVLARRRSATWLGGALNWPARNDIDAPLLGGAALFGIGWGLVGLCPGPAITNLATLSPGIVLFVAAMATGMMLRDLAGGARSERVAADS